VLKHCKNCDRPLKKSDLFCRHCGTKVEIGEEPLTEEDRALAAEQASVSRSCNCLFRAIFLIFLLYLLLSWLD
jgi:uncharacterized Zn finger protein (UPF0148 family)